VFRRYSLPALLLLTVLSLGYIFAKRRAVPLPAEKEYSQLPVQFRDALQRARADVRNNPSPKAIEQLARLYQSNRLFSEATLVYKDLGTQISAEDRYDLALLSLEEGDLPQAALELQGVLKIAPDYRPAEITLAEVWFKLGKTADAETAYHHILCVVPDQPAANLGLARIELQQGHDEKAAALLEALLAKHPEQTDAVALLSQLWSRRGNADRANALAKWSRQRPAPVPDDPWRENLLRSCYNIQTLSLEFENYANAGQLEKALPLLDRVESLDPKNWIPDFLRGWSQAQSHHLDDAVASYRRALEKGGDKEKLVPLLAAALNEKGENAEALKVCADAAQELPDSMPILVAYENIVSKRGDTAGDARLLKRMLEKEPFTYSTNLKLSRIYWESGHHDDAVPYLKQIADLYPADVTSRALLGEYYVSKNEPILAISFLEAASNHAEDNPEARSRLRSLLGNAYLQKSIAMASAGKFEEAGEAAERAGEFLPGDVRTFSAAAENFAQAKAFSRAGAALQKLISLQPENPTLYLSLGDVEAQDNQLGKAREHWQMALERTPPSDAELRPEIQSRLRESGSGAGR